MGEKGVSNGEKEMNKAQRRQVIIDEISRIDPNSDRVCMAAYIERMMPYIAARCDGTEFEGKERVIAMRAYEKTPR